MRDGAVLACYGSTSGVDVAIGMGFILKNCEFKGSTMGSFEEFQKAVAFIAQHKIRPVVHTVLEGLDQAEVGFELMKVGGQFGKIVIAIEKEDKRKL